MSSQKSIPQGKLIKAWQDMLLRTFLAGCILVGNFYFHDSVLANRLPIPSPIYLKGKLIPVDYVELGFGSATRADEVFVQEGDRVKVGTPLIQADNYPARMAELAKAELEQTLAEIDLKKLHREAEIAFAQAEVAVATAESDLKLAENRVESLHRSHSKQAIDQAHANLLLAEKKRDQIGEDLKIAQQQYRNKAHILWRFINQRQFRLRLTLLEGNLAEAEQRVVDAREKYADLVAPIDAIDLSIAAANLEMARANLDYLVRERDKKAQLPDPDKLESALARLKVADLSVGAAQKALQGAVLRAPVSGTIVKLSVKKGEWSSAGQKVVTIADLRLWNVEVEDLAEEYAPLITHGEAAQFSFWVYPDLSFSGKVDSIDLVYQEEDGEITYTMTLSMEENDPRLYWGMTTDIALGP